MRNYLYAYSQKKKVLNIALKSSNAARKMPLCFTIECILQLQKLKSVFPHCAVRSGTDSYKLSLWKETHTAHIHVNVTLNLVTATHTRTVLKSHIHPIQAFISWSRIKCKLNPFSPNCLTDFNKAITMWYCYWSLQWNSFHSAPSREVGAKGHLHMERPRSTAESQWGIADLLKGRTRTACTLQALSCRATMGGS